MRQADTSNVQKAMQKLATQQQKEREEKMAREKELAKVKVNDSDVELIVREFEIHRREAERKIKENGGDLKKTIVTLLNA